MKKENVLYTDGHDVTVTDSVLRVRKKWYNLDAITKHGFSILRPVRLPGILLSIVGLMLGAAGARNLITQIMPGLANWALDANHISIVLGLLVISIGGVATWSMGERYAVSITTLEGEKHVVVSRRKDYITQIVHALNGAFFLRVQGNSERSTRQRFTVSSR